MIAPNVSQALVLARLAEKLCEELVPEIERLWGNGTPPPIAYVKKSEVGLTEITGAAVTNSVTGTVWMLVEPVATIEMLPR